MFKKIGFLVGIAALLILASASMAQRPDAPIYAQSGEYVVGTTEFLIEDGERLLKGTLWYPALNPNDESLDHTYQDGLAAVAGQALEDADFDMTEAPYPVILFSHGSGGLRWQSVFYTQHLASQGFVVAAIDHPGNTILDQLTITDNAQWLEQMTTNFALRPLDMLRLIDHLDEQAAESGAWAGLLNMDKLGVSGHSFGGYTALALGGAQLQLSDYLDVCDPNASESACFLGNNPERYAELRGLDEVPEGLWEPTTDPRIQAIVTHAPCCFQQFGEAGLANVEADLMTIYGTADPVPISSEAVNQMHAQTNAATSAIVSLEHANHYIFVDACSDLQISFGFFDACSDDVWDMARAHDLTNYFSTAFFKMALQDDPEARAALQAEAVDFPAVDYQIRGLD